MARDERILEALAAERVLSTTPKEWFDLAHGLVGPEDIEGIEEDDPPGLIERSKVMFGPPTREREEALRRLVVSVGSSSAPARTTRRLSWVPSSVMVAVPFAAMMVLAFAWRAHDPRTAAEPFTIAYQVELSDPHAHVRTHDANPAPNGEPVRSGSVRFRIDQHVTFWLRPAGHGTTDRITFVVFAFDGCRGRTLSLPPSSRSEHGTVYFAASPGELGLTPGVWELAFVLGRPGTLPRRAAEVRPGVEVDGAAPYVVVRERVSIEAKAAGSRGDE